MGWLKIDSNRTWRGVWSEVLSYAVDDIVLYSVGGVQHAFVSRVASNVGNQPDTSTSYWSRYRQPPWIRGDSA